MIGSRKNFNTNRLVRKNYENDARFKIVIERPIWALAVSHFDELLQQNAKYYNHSIEIPVNLFAQILRYLKSQIFFSLFWIIYEVVIFARQGASFEVSPSRRKNLNVKLIIKFKCNVRVFHTIWSFVKRHGHEHCINEVINWQKPSVQRLLWKMCHSKMQGVTL